MTELHLKWGDRVRVTVPGLCRFRGMFRQYVNDGTRAMVEREDDRSTMSWPVEDVELLSG